MRTLAVLLFVAIVAGCAPLPPEPTDPVREERCREPTRPPDKLEGKRVTVCPPQAVRAWVKQNWDERMEREWDERLYLFTWLVARATGQTTAFLVAGPFPPEVCQHVIPLVPLDADVPRGFDRRVSCETPAAVDSTIASNDCREVSVDPMNGAKSYGVDVYSASYRCK